MRILNQRFKKLSLLLAQAPNEYVEEIETRTLSDELHWTSIKGMNMLYTEDNINRKSLHLLLEDNNIYLTVASDNIYRLEEYSEIFKVTNMKFPIYLYEKMFSISNQ